MDEKLYRYRIRIFLSTKRYLSNQERELLEKLLEGMIEKRGCEKREVVVYRRTAMLDFSGKREINAESFVRESERAFGLSIWENYRVQKTLEIDVKKLI
ncbi:MAG: hypothetical protein SVE93_04945 [Candidatus Thermoplasmatota archaeon]|nr:hypothetical protein [Candidatus Thermoplasmatota archaeon]